MAGSLDCNCEFSFALTVLGLTGRQRSSSRVLTAGTRLHLDGALGPCLGSGFWKPCCGLLQLKSPCPSCSEPMTDFRPTLGPGSSNSLPCGLSLWSGLLWLFPLGVKIYIHIYISTLFKDSFLHRLYKECTHLPLRSEITSLQILLLCPQANGFPTVPLTRILHAEGIGLGSAGSSWVGDLVMNPSTHRSCEGLRSSSRSSGDRLSRLEQWLCSPDFSARKREEDVLSQCSRSSWMCHLLCWSSLVCPHPAMQ